MNAESGDIEKLKKILRNRMILMRDIFEMVIEGMDDDLSPQEIAGNVEIILAAFAQDADGSLETLQGGTEGVSVRPSS